MMVATFVLVLIAVLAVAVGLGLMMGRSVGLACAVAGALMIGATLVEARLSDRWSGSNVTAEEFAQRFARVPMKIGDWEGEDLPVGDEEREGSGAVGYVSRAYRNSTTGERVDLWLIVGHARNICRHTPDICYKSAGFQVQGKHNSQETLVFEDDVMQPADFLTNSFLKEDPQSRALVRVFWAWHSAKEGLEGPFQWEAPEHPRWRFGNDRALYKIYFTSVMKSSTETADESPARAFALEMLPPLKEALVGLEPGSSAAPSTDATDATDATPAEEAAAEETATEA